MRVSLRHASRGRWTPSHQRRDHGEGHFLLQQPRHAGVSQVVETAIDPGFLASFGPCDQHLHQHVHFTPEQLSRMTDDQLDRAEAAYTTIAALEQEVAAAEAQRVSFSARVAESTS